MLQFWFLCSVLSISFWGKKSDPADSMQLVKLEGTPLQCCYFEFSMYNMSLSCPLFHIWTFICIVLKSECATKSFLMGRTTQLHNYLLFYFRSLRFFGGSLESLLLSFDQENQSTSSLIFARSEWRDFQNSSAGQTVWSG